jgi:hypothetical protein
MSFRGVKSLKIRRLTFALIYALTLFIILANLSDFYRNKNLKDSNNNISVINTIKIINLTKSLSSFEPYGNKNIKNHHESFFETLSKIQPKLDESSLKKELPKLVFIGGFSRSGTRLLR